MSSAPQVTQLLLDWKNGDAQAIGRLTPIIYDELRRLCHVPEPVRVNRFRRQHSGANPSGRHQHPGSARADGRAHQRFRRSGSQAIRDEYCHR